MEIDIKLLATLIRDSYKLFCLEGVKDWNKKLKMTQEEFNKMLKKAIDEGVIIVNKELDNSKSWCYNQPYYYKVTHT